MKDSELLKCIGDATRLSILKTLIGGERCVCEIMAALDVEQTLMSHHLKVLRGCGIIASRRDGKKIIYKIADKKIIELLKNIEETSKALKCAACGGELEKDDDGESKENVSLQGEV